MATMESSLGQKNTEHHAIPVSIKQTPHHVMWSLGSFPLMPLGGGGTPLMVHTGRLCPKGVTFSPFVCFIPLLQSPPVYAVVYKPSQNPLQSYGSGLTTRILIRTGTLYNGL